MSETPSSLLRIEVSLAVMQKSEVSRSLGCCLRAGIAPGYLGVACREGSEVLIKVSSHIKRMRLCGKAVQTLQYIFTFR